MIITISIPDHILSSVERAARHLGISRSKFFARAAQRMARSVRKSQPSRLTARIDAALADIGYLASSES
jgi:metal-responsive CopG/Arc/MetJ family transcriptional regulator